MIPGRSISSVSSPPSISRVTLADLGLDLHPHLKVLKVAEPARRQAGVRVESAADLVMKLKNEAGVL